MICVVSPPQSSTAFLKVFLGNGDGSFRYVSHFANFTFNNGSVFAAIGDFNGDGKLDVAVGGEGGSGVLSIFLGNGDGTFKRGRSYSAMRFTSNIVTADFNGDGKLDLVVPRYVNGKSELSLLLGNGDGTFQAPKTIFRPVQPCNLGPPLLVNDFNGDGNADLAFCDGTKLGILLGNGDGTFQGPTFYPAKGIDFAIAFAAGDFNSDGKTDLITSYLIDPNWGFAIFLGNGDGTFQAERTLARGGTIPWSSYNGILTGDFNSDGLLDFILQCGDFCVHLQK